MALGLGTIFLLVGAILLLFVWFGKPKKKDMVMGLGVFSLVIGALFFFNIFGGAQPATVQQLATTPAVTVTPGCVQQTDGSNDVDVTVRNVLDPTLQYLQQPYRVVWDGDTTSSHTGTVTGGAALSYTTINANPCRSGTFYFLSGTGGGNSTGNSMSGKVDSNTLKKQFIFESSNASMLNIIPRSTAYASIATTVGGGDIPNFNTTVQALAQNGALNLFLDLEANRTGVGAYGSKEGGILLSVDLPNLAVYDINNDFSFSSITSGITPQKVTCPSWAVNGRSADICYQIPQIKASDGLVRMSVTLKSALGDPGLADYPRLYFDDVQWFEDTDGIVRLQGLNDASADVGIQSSKLFIQTS